MSLSGYINAFESFGSVDGPGVRFVVFMQGCNMRCKYCHNPETWKLSGDSFTSQEIFDKAIRYKNYWGKNGGITLSGGEPLLQYEFAAELLSIFKSKKIHTAIDTSGQPFSLEKADIYTPLFEVCDLVLLDIKAYDEKLHKELTGHSNKNILDFARWLSDNNKPMWIRHVLIPGITDTEKELTDINKFISTLKTVEKVEILPYHTLGLKKWQKLGIDYQLKSVPVPTETEIKNAEIILKNTLQ